MLLSIVINTFNRIEDAKIQMELIRNLWSEHLIFKNIKIYHVYNGNHSWYPQKYLEDTLVRCPNPGHYSGAALLIDSGIKNILKKPTHQHHYIIVSSADTWILNPQQLASTITQMEKYNYKLASSRWFLLKALATEFFIIESGFAKEVFPLNIEKIRTQKKLNCVQQLSEVEVYFAQKVQKVLQCKFNDKAWKNAVFPIPYRKHVHYFANRHWTKNLGYVSYHDPQKKKGILIKKGLRGYGESIEKLITTKADFSYYTKG